MIGSADQLLHRLVEAVDEWIEEQTDQSKEERISNARKNLPCGCGPWSG